MLISYPRIHLSKIRIKRNESAFGRRLLLQKSFPFPTAAAGRILRHRRDGGPPIDQGHGRQRRLSGQGGRRPGRGPAPRVRDGQYFLRRTKTQPSVDGNYISSLAFGVVPFLCTRILSYFISTLQPYDFGVNGSSMMEDVNPEDAMAKIMDGKYVLVQEKLNR